MKIQYLFLYTILAVIFTACDDEIKPPTPPEEQYNIISIKSLKEKMSTATGDSVYLEADEYIKGIITANDASGNFYKQLFLQDATAGLQVKVNNTNLTASYSPGDEVVIRCQNLYLSSYAGATQLGTYYENDDGIIQFGGIQSYDEAHHILPQGFVGEPTPLVVSIRDLNVDMEGMLVQFDNVQFRSDYLGLTWADNGSNTNRLITDCDTTLIIRTSSFASFADEVLPDMNGSVIGILSLYFTSYNHDFQVYIRNLDDVNFANARCDDGYITPAGDGTKDDPFNVTKAIGVNSGEGWVKGYIVGTVDGISWEDNSNLEGNFTSSSNIVIADSPDETRLEFCMPVQLPAGDIRNILNLKDHPDNHRKEVMVYGLLTDYYGTPGVKETSGYWLDGTGINPAFFMEPFTANIGSFTFHNVSGDAEWYWASYDNGCMVSNGYNKGANENWLVSPYIDMSSVNGALLSFRHAWNYITVPNDITVWIATDYDGSSAPTLSGTWTQLSIPNIPGSGSWTFVNSGDIDLSTYIGNSKVSIAFKYTCSASQASAWEIGEVKIRE